MIWILLGYFSVCVLVFVLAFLAHVRKLDRLRGERDEHEDVL